MYYNNSTFPIFLYPTKANLFSVEKIYENLSFIDSQDNFEHMREDKNKTEFKKYIKGVFNFYIKDSDIPDPNFPSKKILEIFLPMDPSYLKTYEAIEQGQEHKILDFKGKNIHVFYNGLRRASNIIEKKITQSRMD